MQYIRELRRLILSVAGTLKAVLPGWQGSGVDEGSGDRVLGSGIDTLLLGFGGFQNVKG